MFHRDLVAPRRVLVAQLQGLGDVILATPMLGAIRETWPDATIVLAVASETNAVCVRGSGLIDGILVCRGRSLYERAIWMLQVRRGKFDVAIVGTRQTKSLAILLRTVGGIPVVAADSPSGHLPLGIRSRANSARTPEHRIVSNFELFRLLAPDAAQIADTTFHVTENDRVAAANFLYTRRGDTPTLWLGAHPGSEPRSPQKRYPTELLAESILSALAHDEGVCALLFFGGDPEDDRDYFTNLHPRMFVVADQPLSVVAALIEKCCVFVAGDTGLGHIAAAMRVPVVTLAGPTQIESTHPWGEHHRVLRTQLPLECMPCYGTNAYGQCAHLSCMRTIPPSRVGIALIESIDDCRGTPR